MPMPRKRRPEVDRLVAQGLSHREVAAAIGSTYGAVGAYCHRYGVSSPWRHPRQWSRHEMDELERMWTTTNMPVDDVGAVLGRTGAAARAKANNLGLRRPGGPWPDGEAELLRELYVDLELDMDEIIDALGRTEKSIRSKLKRMKAKRGDIYE